MAENMSKSDDSKKATPAAYLPFKTFMSALDSLEHGLPQKLDRTVWRSQSGIVQGQIMMALRFFDLIDDSDEPTPALHELVENPNSRPKLMGKLLLSSYKAIVMRDLTKMSPKMLEEEMTNYNVQGDTRRKAIAFFLRACKYADLPLHPLLVAQSRNSPGTPRKKRKTKESPVANGNDVSELNGNEEQPSQGTRKTVTLLSGGQLSISLSVDLFALSSNDRSFVFGLIDSLQAYENKKGIASKDAEE